VADAEYVIGLDLGQVKDYTALAVLKRTPIDGAAATGRPAHLMTCNHLARWPLGSPYPRIVADVRELVGRPELGGMPTLTIDGTGVGRGIVAMFIAAGLAARVVPVIITAGTEGRSAPWGEGGLTGRWVPKIELVSAVQAALQSGRLKVVPSLPLADTLRQELLNFKIRVTLAGNETFEAHRQGVHDDLLLACAMACWLPPPPTCRVGAGGRLPPPPRPFVPGGPPRPFDPGRGGWQ
jgi:hypothetical protein